MTAGRAPRTATLPRRAARDRLPGQRLEGLPDRRAPGEDLDHHHADELLLRVDEVVGAVDPAPREGAHRARRVLRAGVGEDREAEPELLSRAEGGAEVRRGARRHERDRPRAEDARAI